MKYSHYQFVKIIEFQLWGKKGKSPPPTPSPSSDYPAPAPSKKKKIESPLPISTNPSSSPARPQRKAFPSRDLVLSLHQPIFALVQELFDDGGIGGAVAIVAHGSDGGDELGETESK
ncbi:unnamed protein product [Linum trigynum]|uniref:Uncharacterized protein n=1 Tax=Linum trigynum TaxID=586398 RepID=A0AAV2GRG5_9ROSI